MRAAAGARASTRLSLAEGPQGLRRRSLRRVDVILRGGRGDPQGAAC